MANNQTTTAVIANDPLKNNNKSLVGQFIDPDAWNVTNPFGAAAPAGVNYSQGYHTGIDFNTAGSGNLITNLMPGIVEKIGNDPAGWGNYVVIRDNNDNYNIYAHLADDSINVKTGDVLPTAKNFIIGTAGDTGQANGTHLHFEIRSDLTDGASALDPNLYLKNNAGAAYDFGVLSPDEIPTQRSFGENFLRGIYKLFGAEFDGSSLKINMIRILLYAVAGIILFMVLKSLIK